MKQLYVLPCDALEAAAQTHLQEQQARKQEPESVPKLVQERERPTEVVQQAPALEPVQVRVQEQVRESVRKMEPGSEMEPPVRRQESELPAQDAPQGN